MLIMSSISSISTMGATLFISANMNQIVWFASFIGYVNNEYSLEYLWSTSKFLDYDFLPLNKLPKVTISNVEINQIESSIAQ